MRGPFRVQTTLHPGNVYALGAPLDPSNSRQGTNGQLIKDRILELEHNCVGIAHNQGNLYIIDGKALYHYTVDGRLVSKMYGDTSGVFTGNNYHCHYSYFPMF